MASSPIDDEWHKNVEGLPSPDALTTSEVECDTTICDLEVKLLPTCHLRIETPDRPNCSIPCSVDSCKVEIHHRIRCPIWTCKEKESTTTPATIITTVKPGPTPPSECGTFCLSMASVNGLFLLFFLILAIYLVVRKVRNRRARGYEEVEGAPLLDAAGFVEVAFNAPQPPANQAEPADDLQAQRAHDLQAQPAHDLQAQAAVDLQAQGPPQPSKQNSIKLRTFLRRLRPKSEPPQEDESAL